MERYGGVRDFVGVNAIGTSDEVVGVSRKGSFSSHMIYITYKLARYGLLTRYYCC